jgi:hypothetical protein
MKHSNSRILNVFRSSALPVISQQRIAILLRLSQQRIAIFLQAYSIAFSDFSSGLCVPVISAIHSI